MYIWETVKDILKSNPANKSAKQVAVFLTISESTIYRYAEDPEGSGVSILTDKIIPFTHFTQDDRLLKHFANACGYQLVKLPETKKNKSIRHLIKDLSKTIKEFADFTQAVSSSWGDNKFSDPEKSQINKECNEVLEEILHLKLEINNE